MQGFDSSLPAAFLGFSGDRFISEADFVLYLHSLLLAAGVAMGAFGAHALRDILKQRDTLQVLRIHQRIFTAHLRIQSWQTATQYQLLHSVALLSLQGQASTRYDLASKLWISGTVLFSGASCAASSATTQLSHTLLPLSRAVQGPSTGFASGGRGCLAPSPPWEVCSSWLAGSRLAHRLANRQRLPVSILFISKKYMAPFSGALYIFDTFILEVLSACRTQELPPALRLQILHWYEIL
jgi:uncharacterized membrane protein YgdD (TMEM256/DUF423 family)